MDISGLLGAENVSFSGVGLHKLHLAAGKELIEPYAGHEYDVDPQAGKENSESSGLGNGDCAGLRVFHVTDFIGACTLAKAASQALIEINMALAVFVKAHCANGACFNAGLAMCALIFLKLGQIRAVIINEGNLVFGFESQRHAAAGAAEAQVILIRLNAGFNDGNKTALMCHIRNGKALLNRNRALAVLFLQLAIEIQAEAGVDGVIAVSANCAAYTGRYCNIGGIANDVLCNFNRHNDRVCVYVAVMPLKRLSNQRADYGLDCQLAHHIGKAHHIYCVFKMLLQEITAELRVAVIKGNAVYLDLARSVAIA